jgi:hypothetical protein
MRRVTLSLVALVATLLAVASAAASPPSCRSRGNGCPPHPVLKNVPSECGERTFVAQVRVHGARPLARVRIELDHRAISIRRDRHAAIPVDCSALSEGKHRITVYVTDPLGRRTATEERFAVAR